MFQDALNLIKNAKNIAVFTHINPDGDAIGSSIAFKLAFSSLNNNIDVYCDDEINSNYKFLNTEKYYVKHEEKKYDLAVVLDCPIINRIGNYGAMFNSASKKMVIDHHLDNSIKANVKLVDENAGSTGVVLYRLLNFANININKEMALALYASVASDTGCFMHSNTTAEAHKITAELLEKNIDISEANYRLFKRKTKKQAKLFVKAINNMQYHEDNQIAITVLQQKDLIEADATYLDTLGIIHYVSGIENIKLALTLTESRENCYKVSLRSSFIDTTIIAKHFKGGGHKAASGCSVCGKKENVIDKLLEICKREI